MRKEQDKVKCEYWTSKDLANLFNISLKAVIKWREQGKIPGAIRCGYSWRFNKKIIQIFIDSGELLLKFKKHTKRNLNGNLKKIKEYKSLIHYFGSYDVPQNVKITWALRRLGNEILKKKISEKEIDEILNHVLKGNTHEAYV